MNILINATKLAAFSRIELATHNCICKNFLITTVSVFLVLGAYSTSSLADYYVWYDNENRVEQQIYAGNTLLTPPNWACARKFSNPSYYRHLDTYHGTLDSADFWKDIYIWVPKPGCPYTSEVHIEYVDESQSFPPSIGAIGLEISTKYSSRWVDEDGSWPVCQNCAGPDGLTDDQHEWGNLFSELAILKLAILEKDSEKFNKAVTRTDRLLISFEKDMSSSILKVDSGRSKEDQYLRINIEENALSQLSKAREKLRQCVSEYTTRRTSSAYSYCDLGLQDLQQSKILWRSRD